jgi:hypothetical protein
MIQRSSQLIHQLNLERLNLERPNLERLNLEWTEPRMDWTSNGPNPEWDSTANGLNPKWDWTPNGPNPEWDWTPNGTESRIGLNPEWTQPRLGLNPEWTQPRPGTQPRLRTELRMGLNLDTFLSTLNGLQCVRGGVHQKNGFKKEIGIESELRMGLNLDFPLNLEYGVQCQGVHSTQLSPFYVESHSYIHIHISHCCIQLTMWSHSEKHIPKL